VVEAVMWIILVTTDGKTEMDFRRYYQSWEECKTQELKWNSDGFRYQPEGWTLKSTKCTRFLQPLLKVE
jgi:hypothetical protein